MWGFKLLMYQIQSSPCILLEQDLLGFASAHLLETTAHVTLLM